MPILSVHHLTRYRYRRPVSFGEHRIMFRPREGHDLRLISTRLDITPEPVSLRWLHDVFGNSVAVANFTERAAELRFESRVVLEHTPSGGLDFPIEPDAETYPFSYDVEDIPDLARCIERQYPDPDHAVERWARGFLRRDGPTGTRAMLASMTQAIRADFTYISRAERGVQAPTQTLRLNSGTCRDFAVLMIEAVRALGLAAQFVSGYLYVPERGVDNMPLRGGRVGGGATHAWVRVYLPGAGWIELDPTNGIIGNRDLIRVAIARDHRHVLPLHGTFTGFPSDDLGMTVTVHVSAVERHHEAELSPIR